MVFARTNKFATTWCPLWSLNKDAPGATSLLFVMGSQRDMDSIRLNDESNTHVMTNARMDMQSQRGGGKISASPREVHTHKEHGFCT